MLRGVTQNKALYLRESATSNVCNYCHNHGVNVPRCRLRQYNSCGYGYRVRADSNRGTNPNSPKRFQRLTAVTTSRHCYTSLWQQSIQACLSYRSSPQSSAVLTRPEKLVSSFPSLFSYSSSCPAHGHVLFFGLRIIYYVHFLTQFTFKNPPAISIVSPRCENG